jgi:polar amino acid transport system substrate-binding protein
MRMPRHLLAAFLVSLFVPHLMAQSASTTIAPGGTLRGVFLADNPVQGRRDASTGVFTGPVPDLVRELGRRLGIPSTVIPAGNAAAVIAALKSGQADIGFLAYEQTRAREVDYGSPFVVMRNSYLVTASSNIHASGDVDRSGLVVAAVRGQTQQLFVSRTLKAAQIRVLETMPPQGEVERLLTSGAVQAFAINRQRALEAQAASPARLRTLPDSFLDVDQCVVVKQGERARLDAVNRLMNEIGRSGFYKESIERAKLTGVDPPRSGK